MLVQIFSVFYFYLFISNRKDMGSNPVNSKSVNSVCTNKKISHLSSLLQYNYLTKNQSKEHKVLFKNFLLQKQYHPNPHLPPFICACSMPQQRKKVCTTKDYLFLLVYLYLLVYAPNLILTQSLRLKYTCGKRAVYNSSSVFTLFHSVIFNSVVMTHHC